FIIAMDILSTLLDDVVQQNFMEGAKIYNRMGVIKISNGLYVDDTLVFCGANIDQLQTLKVIILYFEAISRLKVNFQKSLLIPIGTLENPHIFASILGCIVIQLPTTYLGLPLRLSITQFTFGSL